MNKNSTSVSSATPGISDLKMPIVSDSELPAPVINYAPPKQKTAPWLIIAIISISLVAFSGICLIIIGLIMANRPLESVEPIRVVEVAPSDCVGEKPDFSLSTDENGEDLGDNSGNSSNSNNSNSPIISDSLIPASSRTYASENCTLMQGPLMLINPVFQVKTDYITARKRELVDITKLYQIKEGVKANGTPLLDSEAAVHLSAMVKAYRTAYPQHDLETRSCFRSAGTNCGRLCYATGTTDHHTGYTCDLIDPKYGTSLNTDHYDQHIEWQWLKENSYKYGFIDRFPAAWAGGSMDEPVNINNEGSTGLYETWHYRYVGVDAATEIATGKYNNGEYDSLEHYLKARGIVDSLTAGTCRQ